MKKQCTCTIATLTFYQNYRNYITDQNKAKKKKKIFFQSNTQNHKKYLKIWTLTFREILHCDRILKSKNSTEVNFLDEIFIALKLIKRRKMFLKQSFFLFLLLKPNTKDLSIPCFSVQMPSLANSCFKSYKTKYSDPVRVQDYLMIKFFGNNQSMFHVLGQGQSPS